MPAHAKIVPLERIDGLIHVVRGQKVMLDSDLAVLYGVATRVLNQAVQRNRDRFPEDFMFQLSSEEAGQLLRSQIVISNAGVRSQAMTASLEATGNPQASGETLRSQIVTSSAGRGGRRYRAFVFTEQGVAMLSGVINSPRAVQVNIEIMRAFVRLRQWLASSADLARRLAALERKYDGQFKVVFTALRGLMAEPKPQKPAHGREIGFHTLPTLLKSKPKSRTRKVSSRTDRKL